MKKDKNKKAQESSQVDANNSNIDLKDFKTLEDFISREGSVYSLMSYAGFCKEVHYPCPHRSVGENG